MRRALITGITGQDGAYLANLLIKKGYKVYGTFRRTSTPNFWRLNSLDTLKNITLIPMELTDLSSVIEAIHLATPDEIYNLAAQSFVGRSFEEPLSTSEVTGLGLTRLLEAVRVLKFDSKIYQASTSELYGNNMMKTKNEREIFHPESPYAASKLYSYWISKIYRNGYNMFISNGILFNHESPLRGLEFVTRKVTNSVARIRLGLQDKIELGNLNSVRDWGYAGDYVEAMWKILQIDKPDDFVIATGIGHSVGEMVNQVFEIAGLDSKDHIVINNSLKRILDVNSLIGDHKKAECDLGWVPKTSFYELMKMMYDCDFKRWSKFLNGETVIWDAPSYDNNANIANVRYSLKV